MRRVNRGDDRNAQGSLRVMTTERSYYEVLGVARAALLMAREALNTGL